MGARPKAISCKADLPAGRSLVAHDNPGEPALGLTGTEPTMREYFFERVRPIIESALRDNRRDTWPLITQPSVVGPGGVGHGSEIPSPGPQRGGVPPILASCE